MKPQNKTCKVTDYLLNLIAIIVAVIYLFYFESRLNKLEQLYSSQQYFFENVKVVQFDLSDSLSHIKKELE